MDLAEQIVRLEQQLRDAEQKCARLQVETARQSAELERSALDRARLHDQLLHPHRMEAAGTLAAGVAHDMNNVLASIMSFAEVLLDDRHASHVRADLEQIVAQAERGAALTRSLLAFSRKGQYRKQVVDINKLVREMLPLLARTLPKTIQFDTALADTGSIEGDPVQLVQVLVNLGINAADAMEGNGKLSISTELVHLDAATAERLSLAPLTPQPHLRIRIADTGCGMDEATRQRVFEPFFTTKPQGQGTGLGLSLVWGVIRNHGGAVEVESRLGHGTTFWVHLPLTDAVASKPIAIARPQASASDTTILVVDDEPVVRAGTTRILERTGYKVLGACDGAEALRVYAANAASIGLVILDMGMPVMNGAECFRQLRSITSVPVLIATGYAIDREVQTLVANGAALIEKPFSSSDLVVEVTQLLEQYNSAAFRRVQP